MWPSEEFEMEFGDQESENFETGHEGSGELEWEEEYPLSEAMEMELAAELLSVSNEAELEQFLGSLIKKAGKAVGSFVRSPVGKALGGILKGAAKKALPIVGGALGGYLGGPAGAKIGGQLASTAGKAFGLELEGLSPEDQEFEVARKFVRLASAAAQNAAKASPTVPPAAVAKKAVVIAARKHAPGLLGGAAAGWLAPGLGPVYRAKSGRWIRRGSRIILIGA